MSIHTAEPLVPFRSGRPEAWPEIGAGFGAAAPGGRVQEAAIWAEN